ncbi:hypothetical protein M885DRAFT_611038, partial [Pelagophyceae sp. CCMP2097]
MARMRRLSLLCLGARAAAAAVAAECKVLETIQLEQQAAPTDISGVLASVTARINDASAEAVKDVQLTWEGAALHHTVGAYSIRASVVTVGDATVCYTTDIDIVDTNECTARGAWRHACGPSATCVNTIGSYECACAGDALALPHADFDCAGYSSTRECCASAEAGSAAFRRCASAFACEADLCASGKCDAQATCTREVRDAPGSAGQRRVATYACACPAGLVGDGSACPAGGPPRVFVDAAGALRPGAPVPCGCQRAARDACAGVHCGAHARCVNAAGAAGAPQHVCECATGFSLAKSAAGLDECVDLTLPELSLKGPSNYKVGQCGAPYEELGVSVVDDNAAAYERTLRISYSDPRDFPSRAPRTGTPFFKVGDYRVSYRVDTPWTNPPFVEATRAVRVEDVDECAAVAGTACAHACVPRAKCANTRGSYACTCPGGTEGDGFRAVASWDAAADWRVSPTYRGGTGCADVAPPTLVLLGPNPVVLRVERCTDLAGKDRACAAGDVILRDLEKLAETAPHRLCGGEKGLRCFRATDADAATGAQRDVSARVQVGKPVRAAALHEGHAAFTVPYTVSDAAGNVATQDRVVVIKQLSLLDVEAELRPEAARDGAHAPAKSKPLAMAPKANPAAPPERPPAACPAARECPASAAPGVCPGGDALAACAAQLAAAMAALEAAQRRVALLGFAALALGALCVLALALANDAPSARGRAAAPPQPATPT